MGKRFPLEELDGGHSMALLHVEAFTTTQMDTFKTCTLALPSRSTPFYFKRFADLIESCAVKIQHDFLQHLVNEDISTNECMCSLCHIPLNVTLSSVSFPDPIANIDPPGSGVLLPCTLSLRLSSSVLQGAPLV